MPRADAARNRDRVLGIGRQMLDAGDDSLALNEVARRAGLGVATVYRHFPTRRALLEALMEEPLDQVLAEARAALAAEDAGAGLVRISRAVLARELDRLGFAEVFAAAVDERPGTTARKGELLGLAEQILARACAGGVVPAQLTAADVRRLLCGVGHAARLDPADPAGRAEVYLDLLLAGLRAQAREAVS